jgi:hypothetical protein
MPSNEGLYRDASNWNLDRLRLEPPPIPYLPGRKALVPFRRELGVVKSLRFGELGTTRALYSSSNDIYSISPWGHHTRILSHDADGTIIDFEVLGHEMHLLDATHSTILIPSSNSKVPKANRLPVSVAMSAKLVVERKMYPSIFVGPTKEGQIIVLNSSDGAGLTAVRLLTIRDANGNIVRLQPGAEFCLEPRGHSGSTPTLLVPDPNRSRILEVDSFTGQAIRTIGDASTPDPAFPDLRFDSPIAITVFRPEGSGLKDFLDSNSKKIIETGHRSLPRTILVADHGAGRIVKLVEMPDSIQIPTSLQGGATTPLIGTGDPPLDEEEEFQSAPDRDLSQIAIPAPTSLKLSEQGELLVQTTSQTFFILLTPQTAIPENIEYHTSLQYPGGGWS